MSSKAVVREDELTEFDVQVKKNKQKLTEQRNFLIGRRDTYETLYLKILNDNSNELFHDKIMISIGDGYFVEKNRRQATQFLNRSISRISEIIDQHTDKIESCTKLLSISSNEAQDSTNQGQHIKESNEEGLPFMDIVEELDDEGNVINVKINNKTHEATTPPTSKDAIESKIIESTTDEVEAPVNNEYSKEEFVDIVEELDEDGNVINVKFNNKLAENQEQPKKLGREKKKKSGKPVKFAKTSQTEVKSGLIKSIRDNESKEKLQEIDQENNEDQFNELLEDMEIISKPDSSQNRKLNFDTDSIFRKVENLKVSQEDRSKIKEILLQEIKKREQLGALGRQQADREATIEEINDEDINGASSQLNDLANDLIAEHEDKLDGDEEPNEAIQDHIMIENKDLLELELLADQIQDDYNESHMEDNEDDYEFEFEDEEDDDEDEGNESHFFGDKTMNSLLWSQVSQLRKEKQKNQGNDTVEENQGAKTTTSVQDEPKQGSNKKSVKFADELDIHEIDRISPQDYPEPKKLSRFKQLKEREQENKNKRGKADPQLADIIERSGELQEEPVGDIVERTASIVMEITSDTKNDPVIGKKAAEKNSVGAIMENPFGDIVERSVGKEKDSGRTRSTERSTRDVTMFPSHIETERTQNNTHYSGTSRSVIPIGKNNFQSGETVSTESDTGSITNGNELMDMIRLYNAELDNIEGPVINGIEDIGRLNKLQDQIEVDDYEIHDHEHGNDHVHNTEEDQQTSKYQQEDQKKDAEKDQIVTDIQEKDSVEPNELELQQTIEQETLDTEVQREYYNMKSRLNTRDKQQTPKEFEQLDTTPRVSKFKQRLSRT